MTVRTRSNEFLSPTLDPLSINADSALPVVSDKDLAEAYEYERAWQHLIDYQLIEWGKNPDQFDDEGVEPLSPETILRAIKIAERFQSRGFPPPDSVVPDANGGIVFERRERDILEVLHIWGDGTSEYQQFQGMRMVERSPL